MRLRVTAFNEGRCLRTGDLYYWTGERWRLAEFQNLDDLTKKRLEKRGIDIETMYRNFQLEVRMRPPEKLLLDLATAPVVPAHDIEWLVSENSPRIRGWKKRRPPKRRSA